MWCFVCYSQAAQHPISVSSRSDTPDWAIQQSLPPSSPPPASTRTNTPTSASVSLLQSHETTVPRGLNHQHIVYDGRVVYQPNQRFLASLAGYPGEPRNGPWPDQARQQVDLTLSSSQTSGIESLTASQANTFNHSYRMIHPQAIVDAGPQPPPFRAQQLRLPALKQLPPVPSQSSTLDVLSDSSLPDNPLHALTVSKGKGKAKQSIEPLPVSSVPAPKTPVSNDPAPKTPAAGSKASSSKTPVSKASNAKAPALKPSTVKRGSKKVEPPLSAQDLERASIAPLKLKGPNVPAQLTADESDEDKDGDNEDNEGEKTASRFWSDEDSLVAVSHFFHPDLYEMHRNNQRSTYKKAC